MQKSDRLGFQRTLNGCDEELHKIRYKCLLGPPVEDRICLQRPNDQGNCMKDSIKPGFFLTNTPLALLLQGVDGEGCIRCKNTHDIIVEAYQQIQERQQ